MDSPKKVLWIDEEQMALDTYREFFERVFGDEFEIIPEMPLEEIGDMVDRIQKEEYLVALILDQRLKSAGTAKYTGIELADAVRRIYSKIPIYILTNYQDDIDEQDYFQVEYILEKDFMHNDNYLNALSARVRRHANIYKDIISNREERFDELLRKSVAGTLVGDEIKEFTNLDFSRSKKVIAEEEPWAIKLKQELDEHQNLLKEIQKEIASKKGEE